MCHPMLPMIPHLPRPEGTQKIRAARYDAGLCARGGAPHSTEPPTAKKDEEHRPWTVEQ